MAAVLTAVGVGAYGFEQDSMSEVEAKDEDAETLKEAADVAHRYSREIEHSDENKGLLEETLTREEEFRLRALLAAL